MPSAVGKWIFHKNITSQELTQYAGTYTDITFKFYLGYDPVEENSWSAEDYYLGVYGDEDNRIECMTMPVMYSTQDGWNYNDYVPRLIDVLDDNDNEDFYNMLSALATKIEFLDFTNKNLLFNSDLNNSEYTGDIYFELACRFSSGGETFQKIWFDLYHNNVYSMSYDGESSTHYIMCYNENTWVNETYRNIVFLEVPHIDPTDNPDDVLTLTALINVNSVAQDLPVHKLGWKLIS